MKAKTVVLYQMTVVFCRRFLPKHGDRIVDQMVQAARSSKQNIVEGLADGVTSTEMELKLLNVARASIKELKEDYLDTRQEAEGLHRKRRHSRAHDGGAPWPPPDAKRGDRCAQGASRRLGGGKRKVKGET